VIWNVLAGLLGILTVKFLKSRHRTVAKKGLAADENRSTPMKIMDLPAFIGVDPRP
jgi:hypothetical protein